MNGVSNYVELELDGETLFIEVAERNLRPQDDGFMSDTENQKIDQKMFEKMLKASSKVIERLKEFHADEMEINFGIKFDGGLNVGIAKTDLEGQYGVKLIWKDKKTEDKCGDER